MTAAGFLILIAKVVTNSTLFALKIDILNVLTRLLFYLLEWPFARYHLSMRGIFENFVTLAVVVALASLGVLGTVFGLKLWHRSLDPAFYFLIDDNCRRLCGCVLLRMLVGC